LSDLLAFSLARLGALHVHRGDAIQTAQDEQSVECPVHPVRRRLPGLVVDGEGLEQRQHARGEPKGRAEIAEELGDVHHSGFLPADARGSADHGVEYDAEP